MTPFILLGLIALVGILMFALSSNSRVARIGEILLLAACVGLAIAIGVRGLPGR